MTRRINAAGLSHIQQWEGKRLTSYQDVVGIWQHIAITIHDCSKSKRKNTGGNRLSDAKIERGFILEIDTKAVGDDGFFVG